MSVELRLDAEKRTDTGKGASRRLRRAKKLPAVMYGADKDAQPLQLDEQQVLRLIQEETFFSQVIDVYVGKQKQQCVLKDMQRHPFKPLVSHLDLLRIKADEKLKSHIPIHFLNEDKAKGVKEGGVIHHDMIEIEVECLPRDLPEYIEVDVADLDIGDSIHLSQIPVPKNVEFVAMQQVEDAEQDPTLVSLHQPKVTQADIEQEEEEAAVAEADAAAAAEQQAEEEKGEESTGEESGEDSGDKE